MMLRCLFAVFVVLLVPILANASPKIVPLNKISTTRAEAAYLERKAEHLIQGEDKLSAIPLLKKAADIEYKLIETYSKRVEPQMKNGVPNKDTMFFYRLGQRGEAVKRLIGIYKNLEYIYINEKCPDDSKDKFKCLGFRVNLDNVLAVNYFNRIHELTLYDYKKSPEYLKILSTLFNQLRIAEQLVVNNPHKYWASYRAACLKYLNKIKDFEGMTDLSNYWDDTFYPSYNPFFVLGGGPTYWSTTSSIVAQAYEVNMLAIRGSGYVNGRIIAASGMRKIAEYKRLIRNPEIDLEEIKHKGREVFTLLFGRGEAIMNARAVSVVHDGFFADLPLEALYTGSQGFLGKNRNIYYTSSQIASEYIGNRYNTDARRGSENSLSRLKGMKHYMYPLGSPYKKDYSKEVLAFGNASYGSGSVNDKCRGLARLGNKACAPRGLIRKLPKTVDPKSILKELKWANLPGTADELAHVRKVLSDATVFSGTAATKDRFMQLYAAGELYKFRTLHFAVHGFADPNYPELASLVFSQEGRPGSNYLTVDDLRFMHFSQQLILLSACDTGAGVAASGQGVRSLAYAFLEQGAKSVIGTLWPINDFGTSELMKRFYEIKKRHEVSDVAALAKARTMMMQDSRFAHPYYWAPFIMYGAVMSDEIYELTTMAKIFRIKGVRSDDILNMRSAPNYKSKMVGEIPFDGIDVLYDGMTKQVGKSLWMYIRYKNTHGWVNSNYLEPQL